jgi:hypothetical protein
MPLLADGVHNRVARGVALAADRVDENIDLGPAKIGHPVDVVRRARLAVHRTGERTPMT